MALHLKFHQRQLNKYSVVTASKEVSADRSHAVQSSNECGKSFIEYYKVGPATAVKVEVGLRLLLEGAGEGGEVSSLLVIELRTHDDS